MFLQLLLNMTQKFAVGLPGLCAADICSRTLVRSARSAVTAWTACVVSAPCPDATDAVCYLTHRHSSSDCMI